MANFQKLFETLAGLPVASKRVEIVRTISGQSGAVIVSAETGSGKSLLLPASLSDEVGEAKVLVCVPRVFLAVNNAETVAELAGLEVGQEVGYATGEIAKLSQNTRLIFATYGSALARGLILSSDFVIFDEVHEGGMDASVARALVHRRRVQGDQISVIEMSATMNRGTSVKYWAKAFGEERVKSFAVEGKAQPCEIEHQYFGGQQGGDAHVEAISQKAVELFQKRNNGGLIFRPGVAQCEETAVKINELARKEGVELKAAAIYGALDHKERSELVRKLASGEINILVGTNVIESGVNLKGVDWAISCGLGKELVLHENGSLHLDERPLPVWRLTQQAGRVRRFSPGHFTLISDKGFDERPVETVPEISRLPLTALVTTCAEYGVRAGELEFDVPVSHSEIEKAEVYLQNLQIIDENYQLTPEGQFGKRVPLGSESDSILWEARKRGVLSDMITVVSIMEQGSLKAKLAGELYINLPEGGEKSDWLVELAAFKEAERRIKLLQEGDMEELEALLGWDFEEFQTLKKNQQKKFILNHMNVSVKKFYDTKKMIQKLRKSLSRDLAREEYRPATPRDIRLCVLAGEANSLHVRGDYANQVRHWGSGKFNISRNSKVVFHGDYEFATGSLITITSKGRQFTFFTQVTVYTEEDIKEVLPYLVRGGQVFGYNL